MDTKLKGAVAETGRPGSASHVPLIKNWNDVLTGATFIGIAGWGLWLAQNLRMGTVVRMGPGWLPTASAYVLIALGIAIAVRSLFADEEKLARWYPRPLILICAAIAFFSVALDRLGLPITICGVVIIAGLADTETRWRETLILAIGLAVAASLIFVDALGLPMPLWPEFF
ncbi:tripartite tricarboxylate transporter TctB family protein [Xanthobacter pseudotagetidis]|uniref:tripartite tricarboxylate transporter TctB family protein n=1 Tax=Xanthobacter pseudotagetidis TaxID=3119911 RepID=UPI003728DAE3